MHVQRSRAKDPTNQELDMFVHVRDGFDLTYSV